MYVQLCTLLASNITLILQPRAHSAICTVVGRMAIIKWLNRYNLQFRSAVSPVLVPPCIPSGKAQSKVQLRTFCTATKTCCLPSKKCSFKNRYFLFPKYELFKSNPILFKNNEYQFDNEIDSKFNYFPLIL